MTGVASRIVLLARRAASLFFVAALVVACGGGDEPVQPVHPPTISNLRYSPATAVQVPGGTATISGTFDFTDAGGDIASVRITSSAGADMTNPTPQLAGIAGGTAVGQVQVSVDQPGKYSFEFSVTDRAGMTSNRLSGTFEVVAPVDHPPSITNLKYSPAFAEQSPEGVASISGSVDFQDAGGDMVQLELATSWGPVQRFSTLEFTGVTGGTVRYNIAVPTSQAGSQTFEVFVTDGRGKVSNRLAGLIEIRAPAPGSHVPVVSNLGYSPTSAAQAQGGMQPVAWRLDFSDSLGDVVRVRITGTGGLDATFEMPQLNGQVSGVASGTFLLSTASVGKFPFEVWAIDSGGNASNRLSGTFEVLPRDTWTALPVLPPVPLNGIAWNGRYVAVGGGGTVMESPDLMNWSTKSIGPDFGLMSVAGSPSRFVAVGGSAGSALVTSSTDAGVWTVAYRASVPSTLTRVIWGGSQFVAVGCEFVSADVRYALILTSPDGITWTQRSPRQVVLDAELRECGMKSVVWSGSVYIASGRDPDWSPTLWRSTDAVSWVREGDLTNDSVWMGAYDLAWGNGRFVAVGPSASNGDAPAFTSLDGITWKPDTVVGPLPEMNAVTAGPGTFVAVGPTHRQTSPDGFNWTPIPMTGCGNAVTSDGTRFVAVGSSICRSP